jgi:hypothetical protein
MFGRTPGQLIGKHIWTEFPEGVGQPFDLIYRKAHGGAAAGLPRGVLPPYEQWFENRIYPSPQGLTIYFHDITERKRAEQQILQLNEDWSAGAQPHPPAGGGEQGTGGLSRTRFARPARAAARGHRLRADLGSAGIRAAMNEEAQRYLDNIVIAASAWRA